MVDVLGPEIVECMAWRKGALMYMYCATIQEEDKDRIKEDPQCHAEVMLYHEIELNTITCCGIFFFVIPYTSIFLRKIMKYQYQHALLHVSIHALYTNSRTRHLIVNIYIFLVSLPVVTLCIDIIPYSVQSNKLK